ncbi:MAG: S1C family serine protease [Gammaproteobacteria bacterium]|jgi:S1-C subfamily serine protease
MLAILAGAAALLAAGVLAGRQLGQPADERAQERFDLAVQRSLEKAKLPATAARAWETIRPSVVRVRAFAAPGEGGAAAKGRGPKARPAPGAAPEQGRGAGPGADEAAQGTGTGVVILEEGVILTNLHVVAGAARVRVVFDDGLESDATVLSVQPENDLAVLRAHKLPDDLVAATLRSSGDLRPGDRVVAVGFPFGIGPSVSSGVISGLGREYVSEDGERLLGRLIQFDAAANPGNSGGPLVTDEGEVVGIVTGILNPVGQRFFVGIGFAVPIENAAAGFGLPPF